MKNVGFWRVVFLSSHWDQKLGIFVQTFSEVSIEIGRVSFAQHMLNPSRALKGLQMQIPNANGRVRRFRRRQLLRIVVSREKNTMEQFVLVSPKIDKDKCGGVAVVDAKIRLGNCLLFPSAIGSSAILRAALNNAARGNSPRPAIP